MTTWGDWSNSRPSATDSFKKKKHKPFSLFSSSLRHPPTLGKVEPHQSVKVILYNVNRFSMLTNELKDLDNQTQNNVRIIDTQPIRLWTGNAYQIKVPYLDSWFHGANSYKVSCRNHDDVKSKNWGSYSTIVRQR